MDHSFLILVGGQGGVDVALVEDASERTLHQGAEAACRQGQQHGAGNLEIT